MRRFLFSPLLSPFDFVVITIAAGFSRAGAAWWQILIGLAVAAAVAVIVEHRLGVAC